MAPTDARLPQAAGFADPQTGPEHQKHQGVISRAIDARAVRTGQQAAHIFCRQASATQVILERRRRDLAGDGRICRNEPLVSQIFIEGTYDRELEDNCSWLCAPLLQLYIFRKGAECFRISC
jgi:hypothetical protein